MATERVPGLHDLVWWRGAKWLVVRVLRLGRLEISALKDPTVRWVCLAEQLEWQEQDRAWLCTASTESDSA